MKTRAVTGIFFITVMVGSLLFGAYVFSAFYLLLATACLFEFYKLFGPDLSGGGRWTGLILGVGSLLLFMCYLLGFVPISFLTPLLLAGPAVFVVQLFRREPDPFRHIARVVLGLVYVIIPFFCFYALGFLTSGAGAGGAVGTYHYALPLGLLLLIWANDTGAYVLGRAFGRHKLFERISPGKTWEGFGGGVLSALIVSTMLYRYMGVLPQDQWLFFAALVSIAGTLGDLVESMLKRSLGIKDSGGILPGHGGLLDRFDSLLLAAPAVYVFLMALNS